LSAGGPLAGEETLMFEPFAETISKPKWSGIPLRRKSPS
jgi:hypothetical protein